MKKVIVILLTILLMGCETPYQPNGYGGGYSNFALSHDIYKVSFKGNSHTSRDTVHEYLLRRSAELTLEKGYEYFVILDSHANTDHSYYSTPTTVNSQSSTNYSSTTSHTYSTATVNGGQTYQISKHSGTAMIKMLHTNKDYPSAFNAKVILSNFPKDEDEEDDY